ncbi:hypothetical protein LEP1GSC073_0652 [Leptospira noguchii str. Cascata]|nr:hypothetical protein LEP1GSC073_0652 [Leptospira noguchii str. Cascata]
MPHSVEMSNSNLFINIRVVEKIHIYKRVYPFVLTKEN